MWQTETSIEVAAPAERVYEYLADLRRHKEWSRGVAEIEQTTPGPIQVGTEFKATEEVPMKFVSYSRITRLDPPHRVEWTAWDGSHMNVDWAFALTPTGDGTRVVQTAQFRPQSLLGRVLLTIMRKRQIPKENRASLERLKALLEDSSTVAPAENQRA
jgi:uncharacterized membrane protein